MTPNADDLERPDWAQTPEQMEKGLDILDNWAKVLRDAAFKARVDEPGSAATAWLQFEVTLLIAHELDAIRRALKATDTAT